MLNKSILYHFGAPGTSICKFKWLFMCRNSMVIQMYRILSNFPFTLEVKVIYSKNHMPFIELMTFQYYLLLIHESLSVIFSSILLFKKKPHCPSTKIKFLQNLCLCIITWILKHFKQSLKVSIWKFFQHHISLI